MKHKLLIIVVSILLLVAFMMTFTSCTIGEGDNSPVVRLYKFHLVTDHSMQIMRLQRGFVIGDTTTFWVGNIGSQIVIVDTLN